MKITEMSYGETKNLGNFNSARVDMKVEVYPEDDKLEVMAHLKRLVKAQLEAEAVDNSRR